MVGQKSLKVQTKSYRFVLGISDPLCVKVRPYFLEELLKKMLVIDISFVIVHTYMEFLKSGLLNKPHCMQLKQLKRIPKRVDLSL